MAEKTQLPEHPTLAPFTERLVMACGEMQNPPLDSTNPHFKNKFASLLAVSNVVRPVLAKYGIAYRQSVDTNASGLSFVCTYAYGVEHDGTFAEKRLAVVPITVQSNPQQMGSALTYAKRYCLLAAFGLVGDEDDDAEAASKPAAKPAKKASKPKAAAPKKVEPTDAEKEELAQIAASIGNKGAVWAAYKDGGMDAARALMTLAPANVELLDADAEF